MIMSLFIRPGEGDETSRDLSSTEEINENVGEPLTSQITVLPTPNPVLQDFAIHHYLAYVERECHEQALITINHLRTVDEQAAQGDPEVAALGDLLFAQAVEQLQISGAEVAAFGGRGKASLRQNCKTQFSMALNKAAENAVSNERDRANSPMLPFRSTANLQNLLRGANSELYKELGVLGRGGYGKVYRIFSFLDQQQYAVKKMTISRMQLQLLQNGGDLDILAEVRTMAKLGHPNIVQYHHCWLEPIRNEQSAHRDEFQRLLDNQEYTGDESYDTTDDFSQPRSSQAFLTNELSENLQAPADPSNGDFSIIFGPDSDQPSSETKESQLPRIDKLRIRESSKATTTSQRASVQDASRSDVSDAEVEEVPRVDFSLSHPPSTSSTSSPAISSLVTEGTVLCIKMALYPTTLSSYLSIHEAELPSHCFHTIPAAKILQKILDGVHYLHCLNIVHRDLKPANILLSIEHSKPLDATGFVTVGGGACPECSTKDEDKTPLLYIRPCVTDFGLIARLDEDGTATTTRTTTATSTTIEQKPGDTNVKIPDIPTAQIQDHLPVGTKLYRPAKMPNTEPFICPKLDIYSLGIILFELVTKFNTEMERRDVLMNLSDGIFPDGFEKHALYEGIKHMMKGDRDERWGDEEVREWLDGQLRGLKD